MSAVKTKHNKTATPTPPPMMILIVTHYYASHGGGVERVAERLIREILPQGNIHFTWAASNCDKPPVIDSVQALPMKTYNWLERRLGVPWPIWSLGSLWKLRKAIRSTDIVWLHDTLYFGNIAAFRMARSQGLPVAITQHIGPIPYHNPLLRLAMKIADKMFSTRMLKRAQEVVFISDRIAEDYYKRITFTRAIKVVPNGVDLRLFHPPIPENRRFLREQFALKKDQPVLLFVGRFVEKKGLDVIHKLAKQLPNHRFWLVGKGPIQPESWLAPNVHVFRDRKDLSLTELYHAADTLIIPSYGEGFPLVIQEAMACGLPVLCSPETAQGCRPAMSYLHVADLWPHNPTRTAKIWAKKIKNFPVQLPLTRTEDDVASFAQEAWDWPPIANVYTELLTEMKNAHDKLF